MRTKSSLALLALLVLSSCGNEQVDNERVDSTGATPIRVGYSVQGMSASTRGAVVEGSEVTATVLMCDGNTNTNWSGFTKVDRNELDADGGLSKRATVSIASFKVGEAGMSLNPTLYYNKDNTTKSFLAAVAPSGELTGTSVSFSTKDGLQDVMYAPATAPVTSTNADPLNLAFEHRTTQLSFAVKVKKADSNGEWEGKTVSLKSITIQQTSLPEAMDVANGNMKWSSPAADLLVPGIAATVLTGTATPIGNPVMVAPSQKVVLNVVITVGGVDKPFKNVTVKNASAEDLQTLVGNSHVVTLTIEEPKTPEGATTITSAAQLAPWKTGEPGTATLN